MLTAIKIGHAIGALDEGADGLKELFFLFQLDQLAGIIQDIPRGARNLSSDFLRQRKRGAHVTVAAKDQGWLLDVAQSLQCIMCHDHVDALQSDLAVLRSCGPVGCAAARSIHSVTRSGFSRVYWGEKKNNA